MPALVKRIDQHRHELKALRYLLEFYPESCRTFDHVPRRDDFQIPDCQQIFDALAAASTRDEAVTAIRELDLDETDAESFLRLGGEYYYTYPQLVIERAEGFRQHLLELEPA